MSVADAAAIDEVKAAIRAHEAAVEGADVETIVSAHGGMRRRRHRGPAGRRDQHVDPPGGPPMTFANNFIPTYRRGADRRWLVWRVVFAPTSA